MFRLLACTLLLAGVIAPALASPTDTAGPLIIAAAADLQPVLPALLEEFQAQTAIRIQVSFGSSAALTAQIENGAPFDLFLSADTGFPDRLARDGQTVGPPQPYARGTLVLWTRNDAPFHPVTPALLKDPALHSLAIANPQHAPYGRAAVAALQSLGLYGQLQPRLRIAENIGQAAQFVESGNAQAGLLSLTYALTPRLQSVGQFVRMPPSSYPPILQSAVLLRNGSHPRAARALLDFLLSAPVRHQLAAHGLEPPL